MTATSAAGRTLQNPLRSLRHPNFRLLWTGELLRTSAQWMDQITRGFLILELTGSSAHLALITAVRGAPLLVLGLASGVLADRVSRKRLLMASQSMNVAANIAMAVLVLTGTIALWHVYLGAVLIGVGMSLNAPARQSALPSLVPAEDLQHAVVLNTATLNIGQAIGPAIGGLLVATVGIDGAYVAQALLFVIASALIRRIDLPDIVRIGPTSSWRSSAGDGVRYLRHHPVLPKLFLMSLIPLVFVQPFRAVVPAIAVDDLQLGPSGTGLLLASVGVGAVLSVVAMATLPPIRRSGLAIGVCTVGFAVTTALFAMTSVFLLALIVMFAGGVLQAVSRTLTQSMLLEQTEDAFRGRMSSVYVVNRGMMPVGSTMLAGLTPLLGAARSVSTMALIGAVVAGVVGWRSRSTWQQ